MSCTTRVSSGRANCYTEASPPHTFGGRAFTEPQVNGTGSSIPELALTAPRVGELGIPASEYGRDSPHELLARADEQG